MQEKRGQRQLQGAMRHQPDQATQHLIVPFIVMSKLFPRIPWGTVSPKHQRISDVAVGEAGSYDPHPLQRCVCRMDSGYRVRQASVAHIDTEYTAIHAYASCCKYKLNCM